MTDAELLQELKSLPKMSTKLDRCISEVTRDGSMPIEEAIPRLKRHLSLQEESDQIRKKLKLASSSSSSTNESPPKRMLSLSESIGLQLPSKPMVLNHRPPSVDSVITSSPSSNTSDTSISSYHDEDESSLIDTV